MSFNQVQVMGNLGGDPELRYTPQGSAVCNFSIATNEKKKDNRGEVQDITTWFRVTLWNKQAENASKYLTKGSPVFIQGRLNVQDWTDRDGNPRYTLEIQGSMMQFVSGGGQGGGEHQQGGGGAPQYSGGAESGGAPAQDFAPPSSADDDIPF